MECMPIGHFVLYPTKVMTAVYRSYCRAAAKAGPFLGAPPFAPPTSVVAGSGLACDRPSVVVVLMGHDLPGPRACTRGGGDGLWVYDV